MSENISIIGGEISFFEDKSFNTSESAKNNKELSSKNSSNPEKMYDKLNSEIKKYTENGKDSSYISSNSNSKNPINEKIYDSKYWKGINKENKIFEPVIFSNKFEYLKKKLSNKNNGIFINSFDDEFDSDDLEEDTFHNEDIINKVSSIKIQSNDLTSENNNFTDNKICRTDSKEYIINQIKISPLKNSNVNNSNIKNKLNYENEKDEEMNENIENSSKGIYQNYNSEYRARFPNDEIDTKFTNYQVLNVNKIYQKNNDLNNKNLNNNVHENNNKMKLISFPFKNNLYNQKLNFRNTYHKNENKCEKQLINIDDIISGKDNRTTVMIRNIPIRYTEKMLINELIDFEKKYDFINLPFDYEKGGNKGYAFINFNHSYHILLFHEKFQNKKWNYFESKKICELNIANFQGINDIQKHVKGYKGTKKTNSINNINNVIEVPLKYLNKVKIRYPKMIYNERKDDGIFIIKSFQ